MKVECIKHGFYDVENGCKFCEGILDPQYLYDGMTQRTFEKRSWYDILHKEVTFEADVVEKLARTVLDNDTTYTENYVWHAERKDCVVRSGDMMHVFATHCKDTLTETFEARRQLLLQLVLHDASVKGRRVLK